MHAIRLILAALGTAASLHQQPPPPPHCDRRTALVGLGTFATSTVTLGNGGFAPPALASSPAPVAPTAANHNTRTAPIPIPTWRLAGGVEFPTLALNTAGLTADESERAFRNALAAGISHVEFHPGVERDGLARVLRSYSITASNANRRSVFLTTKVETKWEQSPSPSVAAAFVREQLDRDLAVLGVDYVDMLMLRESPDCAVMQAMWAEMEREKTEGRTRSLGVVNYCETALRCLLSTATQRPSVNYLQLHAGMGRDPRGLRTFGETRGIRTFAYGHLGERASPAGDTDELMQHPTLRRIAAAHGSSSEDVALRWVLQSGAAASVRPTSAFELGRGVCQASSACADGLRASADVFRWKLTAAEMTEMDALTSPKGNPTLFSSPGCPDSFFANK